MRVGEALVHLDGFAQVIDRHVRLASSLEEATRVQEMGRRAGIDLREQDVFLERVLDLVETLVKGRYANAKFELGHFVPELPYLAYRFELHEGELRLALGLIGLGEVPVHRSVVRVLLEQGLGRPHDHGGTTLLEGLRDGFGLMGRRYHPNDEHAQEGYADAENQDQHDDE